MPEVIHEMSSKRLGMTCVVDAERPAGRRVHGRRPSPPDEPSANVLALTAGEAMTPNPITIRRDLLAVEALKIMETHKITSVIVTDVAGPSKASCTCTTCGGMQMF